MSRMILIVLVIRVLAIGQLLLLALVIGRGAAPRRLRGATAMLLICTCAYLTLQTPLFCLLHGPVLPLGAQLVPVMLWVFAHMLFERPIDWRIGAAGGAVVVACWAWLNFTAADTAVMRDHRTIALLVQRASTCPCSAMQC